MAQFPDDYTYKVETSYMHAYIDGDPKRYIYALNEGKPNQGDTIKLNCIEYVVKKVFNTVIGVSTILLTKKEIIEQKEKTMIEKTKPFKAVSMPCTEDQFEKELKPILEFLEVPRQKVAHDYMFIVNNLDAQKCLCGGVTKERLYYYGREHCAKFCPKTFIEALGYDYEEVLKGMNSPTECIVLRPILWFFKDQKVAVADLEKYFTKKAIESLIKDKYIK